MEKPKVSKTFMDALEHVRPGLRLAWMAPLERFIITHRHEHTAQFRLIKVVENTDGSFRLPDIRDINYLKQVVDWETIDKYPSMNDMAQFYKDMREKKKAKNLKNRQQWVKDFIRDNRRGIKEAVRRLWYDGVVSDPVERKKKIAVDYGKNLQSLGYSQTTTGIIIPTSYEDKK